MTAFGGGVATLTGAGEPVQLRRAQVAPEYFQIFGVHAALGRTLAAGEDQPGKNHVVVLSHVLWENAIRWRSELNWEAHSIGWRTLYGCRRTPGRRFIRPLGRSVLHASCI